MATSGFQVLLARLPDDVRTKYCAQTLQEELSDVQTRLSACSEAMAHAAQVEAAIASLEAANSDAAIRSSKLSASLTELRALRRSFRQQMQSLLQPFDATQSTHKMTKPASHTQAAPAAAPSASIAPSAAAAAPDDEEDQSAQEVYAEQLKVLEKIERYVTKRRRSTWLSDAVDLAREFASANATDSDAPHAKSLSKRQRKAWTKVVVRAMETLRTALLECAADNIELLPRLVKALKRLSRRTTCLVDLYTESEQLLAAKEREIAEKEQRRAEKAAAAAADKKRKKRKLSDASVASSAASTREQQVAVVQAPPARVSPAPVSKPARAPLPAPTKQRMTITDIRTALTRCTREVKQLRAQFSPEVFDTALTCVFDVAKRLSREFTEDDITALVSSVFTIFEQVERVSPTDKYKSELLRLEATLQRIATAKGIPIRHKCHRMRMTITDIRTALTRCTREVKQLRAQFSPEVFDTALTCVFDVAKRLSREFTEDDITALASIVFAIYDQVHNVTSADKCMSELLRLEATMSHIVTAKGIPITDRCYSMVCECRSKCQKFLAHLRKGRRKGTLVLNPSGPKHPAESANAHLHFAD